MVPRRAVHGPAWLRKFRRDVAELLVDAYETPGAAAADGEEEPDEERLQRETAEWAQHLRELVEIEWEEENRLFKERVMEWPLARLVTEGFTVIDLRMEACGDLFGRARVRFTPLYGMFLAMPMFRRGQQLIVSKSDPLGSQLKAQVLEVSAYAIVCAVKSAPVSQHDGGLWRLDSAPNQTAYVRTVKCLKVFESGGFPPDVCRVLLEIDAEASNSAPPLGFQVGGLALNESQLAAVRSFERRRVGLLQGPPGCGKTYTACCALKAAYRGKPVLAVADSNTAVDQLLSGLLDLGVRAVRIGAGVNVTQESLLSASLEVLAAEPPAGEQLWDAHGPAPSAWREPSAARPPPRPRLGEAPEAAAGLEVEVEAETPPLEALEAHACAAGVPRADLLELQARAALALLRDLWVPDPYAVGIPDVRSMEAQAREVLRAFRTLWAPPALPDAASPWARAPEEEGARSDLEASEAADSARDAEGWLEARKRQTEIIDGAEVVCATIVGCGSEVLDGRRFDFILLDEATQATEPRTLIAISRLSRGGRLVLMGDQQQLPPVCISQRARDLGLGLSLFDRLLSCPALAPAMLRVQYRMHPLIRRWPSEAFYGGRLVDGVSAGQRLPPLGFDWPAAGGVAFLAARVPEDLSPDGFSRENRGEVRLVRRVVASLLRRLGPEGIGIITPYRGQVRLLAEELDGSGVEVRTVDGFQGREKPVIIFSCVRSNTEGRLGFLADHRRLNVALTRARCGLIVVGNPSTLRRDRNWRRWLDFVAEHELEVDAPKA